MLLLRALPLLIVAGAGAAGLWYGPLTDEIWKILLGSALGFATLSSLCMLLFGQEEVTVWRVYLAFFFLLPAALVIGAVGTNVWFELGLPSFDSSALEAWLTDSIADGRVAIYLSCLLFGFHLLWEGLFINTAVALETAHHPARIVQYLIYGVAHAALLVSYWQLAQGIDVPYPYILAWALLLITNDWILIDYYVFKAGAPMAFTHYLRVMFFNAVILGMLGFYAWNFATTGPLDHRARLGAQIGSAAVFAGFWALNAVYLFREVRKAKLFTAPA
jgi:hypothetical protein